MWNNQMVNIQKAIEHGPVEIVDVSIKNMVISGPCVVDWPIKHDDCPSFFVRLPEANPMVSPWSTRTQTQMLTRTAEASATVVPQWIATLWLCQNSENGPVEIVSFPS